MVSGATPQDEFKILGSKRLVSLVLALVALVLEIVLALEIEPPMKQKIQCPLTEMFYLAFAIYIW